MWRWIDCTLAACQIASVCIALAAYYTSNLSVPEALLLGGFLDGAFGLLRQLPKLKRLPIWAKHLAFRWRFVLLTGIGVLAPMFTFRILMSDPELARNGLEPMMRVLACLQMPLSGAFLGEYWHKRATKGRLTDLELERLALEKSNFERFFGI